jgi:hypothetical protein
LKYPDILSITFLAISFSGLVLIAAFINLPVEIQGAAYWRKSIASISFSIVCVLGIIAGVFPSKCSQMFHFRKVEQKNYSQRTAKEESTKLSPLRGHHPDCGNFDSHIFIIRNRAFCAGCTGLIIGAFLSLVGIVPWVFVDSPFYENSFPFLVGFIGVSCGLLQYQLFSFGKGLAHLLINVFFVLSVFFLLVGVDGITQSIIADYFLLSLSIFWIFTRITLSQQSHQKICKGCRLKECNFYKGR